MRIYFGTNRNGKPAKNPRGFGIHFSEQGLTDLRFGWADVPDPTRPETFTLHVAPEKLQVDPAKAAVGNLGDQVLGSQLVFDLLRQEMMAQKRDCLIFVHGFNVSFEEALASCCRLALDLAQPPMSLFLFSWPSNGQLLPFLSYASDRHDARASGPALGRGLQKLAHFLRGVSPENYCGQRLHLLAHSMGNYALRHALQQIRSSTGNLRRLLDQIILFAADEDADTFEHVHKLLHLPDMCRRVTVYHNALDKALIASDLTKGNPDRLGAGGPRNSRQLPDKVTIVNCGEALKKAGSPSEHSYYYGFPRVKEDLQAVLKGEETGNIAGRRYHPETRSYHLIG